MQIFHILQIYPSTTVVIKPMFLCESKNLQDKFASDYMCLDKDYELCFLSDNFVILRSGSWPAMTYTKCSEYTSDTPTPRRLNLVSAIKVGQDSFLKHEISIFRPHLFLWSGVR